MKALVTVALATLAAPIGGLLGGGLLGGCDGAGQGAVEPASVQERSAARGLIGQIAAIAEQPAAPERLLDATDATALVALVAPPSSPPPLPVAGQAAGLQGAAPAHAQSGALAGCLLATGTAATLTECELGDHVIDGTWSMQHQRMHAELVDVFVVGAAGHRGSLWIDANLSSAGALVGDGTTTGALPVSGTLGTTPGTTPGTTIDGSLEASLMWSMDGRDHALDASIRIEGLVLEDPACATGGTITISGRLAGSASTTTTLWFGPTCRDIHISRQTSR